MKKLLNKVQAFVKKNYVACTIISAIILVVIASFIIIGLIEMNKNRIEVSSTNNNLYQYFDKKRFDFAAKISYENDGIVNIKSDEYNIYENSPIYEAEKTKIIMPKQSSIVFYYRQNLTYRLPKFSFMTYDEGSTIINSQGKENTETNFFIYDGLDTYVIPINSKLNIDGNEIELSRYSYIIANNNYVTYYDLEKDVLNTVEGAKSASVTVENIVIDLLKDVTVVDLKVNLLNTKVNTLDIYLED